VPLLDLADLTTEWQEIGWFDPYARVWRIDFGRRGWCKFRDLREAGVVTSAQRSTGDRFRPWVLLGCVVRGQLRAWKKEMRLWRIAA
jgi:hypothetical protein